LFKASTFSSPIFPILGEIFPNGNYIFNIRNMRSTVASFDQSAKSVSYTALLIEVLTGTVRILLN
jgi:hypothetical protein